jgi:hypothetical protein
MQIDESDEKCPNADSSIDKSFEPDSNVTVARDQHRSKHHLLSFSTEEGMQIDESREHKQNGDSPIEESFEPDSNVTIESNLHSEKHHLLSFSTQEGMQILRRLRLPNLWTSRARDSTPTRIPSNETELRGKMRSENVHEKSHDAFCPDLLYESLSKSMEIKSAPDDFIALADRYTTPPVFWSIRVKGGPLVKSYVLISNWIVNVTK